MRRMLVLVMALLLPGSPAAADGVVLESYAGSRPADADRLLGALRDELGLRGFTGGAALSRRINAEVSGEAVVLTAEQIAEVRRLISSGVDQFREGQYEPAVRDLGKGLAMLDQAPATMVANADLRDVMLDGLVFQATAYTRLGKAAEATRAMAELIRSFPDKEISNARHGPEPRRLHTKVKSDLESQGAGKLRVTIDDARTVVFVNERYAGVGSIVVDRLPAGRYRVFVQQGSASGRLHRVDVEAGTEEVLSIAWGLDSALTTRGEFAGFAFAGESERAAGEAALANRVARAVGADGVVVVGMREVQGRRSIVGQYLAVDSTRPLRSAALAADPVAPAPEKVRALARFLAGDESAKGEVIDLLGSGGGGGNGGGGGEGGRARPYRTWKWVLTGAGVAAIATGGVLIAIHQPEEKDGMRNPDAMPTMVPGIITAAGGALLVGAGIYFWIKDSGSGGERSNVAFVPTVGGGLVTLGGRF